MLCLVFLLSGLMVVSRCVTFLEYALRVLLCTLVVPRRVSLVATGVWSLILAELKVRLVKLRLLSVCRFSQLSEQPLWAPCPPQLGVHNISAESGLFVRCFQGVSSSRAGICFELFQQMVRVSELKKSNTFQLICLRAEVVGV